ncbi:MAG: hypothetical protein QM651_17895, partial [Rhodoblastus sp.]
MLHAKGDVVRHGGETLWLCLNPTEDEPSDASTNWSRWLDASAAVDAGTQAVAAAQQTALDRTFVSDARDAVAQDKAAVAEDRDAVVNARAVVDEIIDTTSTHMHAAAESAAAAEAVAHDLDTRSGSPGGIAQLDSDGKVPPAQLPNMVTSVAGRDGVVTLSSDDLADKGAAGGVATLD